MHAPLSETKIKLTKKQEDVLHRLNTLLMYHYFPICTDAMIAAGNKGDTIDESNEMYKLAYKIGYGKAIWDITIDTSAACDGYLPDDKTIEKWNKQLDEEMAKEFDIVKTKGKDGSIWTTYKPKKDHVPR